MGGQEGVPARAYEEVHSVYTCINDGGAKP